METILSSVSQRIVPTEKERAAMNKLSDRLQGEVEQILETASIQGSVSLQGSFARDTWISGDTDLDIFTRFPPTMERQEWKERVLPAILDGLKRFKVVERYAEHPFLEFYADSIRVNVVPCYDVKRGEWKSATDRTPYHTEFMKKNLTDEVRLQARLLKKFSRGIGTYGAEIKIGGFSGMLIDTLALYYQSFAKTLNQASSWTPHTQIEIGKPPSVNGRTKAEPGVELIVIDPVDPNRNLASAVRPEKLWSFVAASRNFLLNPRSWYFFPTKPPRRTKAQIAKRIATIDEDLLAVSFKHPVLVQDVLWGQLMKLERSLAELLERSDFQVLRSATWSDEATESVILLEVDRATLPAYRLQRGPPVAKHEESQSFLERHLIAKDTVRGPWIEKDRWIVEKKRARTSISDVVRASFADPLHGLAIPKRIGESMSGSVKILSGRGVLSIQNKTSFVDFIWDFLEARPRWLKQIRA